VVKTTKPTFTEPKYIITLAFVVSLFMLWGIAMTMGDVLNRHFQHVLHISKSRSTLVQFSMFGAYAVMGVPAGLFMKRFGYKYGVLLGLLLYSFGAFLFIPAANAESFTFFRVALFILACGLATLETVAHPFVASLGSQHTSAQRLNFAQGFNGLGGITGTMLGGYFILKAGQEHSNDLYAVKVLYTVIGFVIIAVALGFFFIKIPPMPNDSSPEGDPSGVLDIKPQTLKGLFKQRHFTWAILAQFCCVAAQGGTWAFFIIYGVEIMKLPADKAAYFFGLSMFLKMIGRFLGAFLLRFMSANTLLAIFAAGNILMCIIIAQSYGWVSYIALIALNFFFSIMFPTIYSLGLKDLGDYKKQASSFIVMGVAGGAVFPKIMGIVADHDVAKAYYLPIICYLFIFWFAVRLSKIRNLSSQ
jgi:FHS family L-fucose permease-like MFS transporter